MESYLLQESIESGRLSKPANLAQDETKANNHDADETIKSVW